ncbi:phytoene synthase [Polymorphobacter multimanifer]|uniref:phytoene/squalene synthase family protein n=1 Tax=Polymorphobacter multimanifer TaxID=1070431 RepID=UPI00166B0D81|nr:phytoene/squalene synthase family protein [Polymorphobacter multimanifer]GGI81173.1 phytoene synthase [Polymorphobacter multimanifer]
MTDVLSHAKAAIARGSKSFALASRLFDAPTRDHAMLLYAWCRHTDDVIDGQVLGEGRNDDTRPPAERLAEVERLTELALAGTPEGAPAYHALARVVHETGMPPQYPRDLIHGFRIDMEERPFHTLEDTLTYCYHVAGCVGVMMAIVMGVDPKDRATLVRASDLGIAFQLNNIARDIIEDAMNSRRYIPDDWLANVGLTPTNFAFPAQRRQLFRLLIRLVDQAEDYELSARHGTPALRNRAAWAVLAAASIYGGIGRKLRKAGPEALESRMRTTMPEKLQAVSLAASQTLVRKRRWSGTHDRSGLWTMPDNA